MLLQVWDLFIQSAWDMWLFGKGFLCNLQYHAQNVLKHV
jgi:hypothetical protein